MTAVDLTQVSVRELNQELHDVAEGQWQVLHPDGRHCIAVGLDSPAEVDIDGHAGYYCAGMNKLAQVTVSGSAGPGVAENMMSEKSIPHFVQPLSSAIAQRR